MTAPPHRSRGDECSAEPGSGRDAREDAGTRALIDWYNDGRSIRQIAAQSGLSRRRVTQVLRRGGITIAPRGRGRPRPARRISAPPPDVQRLLVRLYVTQRLTRAQVAKELGVPEHRVRTWLRDCGIQPRTRGRQNREDRDRPPKPDLVKLYTRQGLPAREVGSLLSSSLGRVLAGLHEDGIPVRTGGNAMPDSAVCLLDALYGDPDVREALARHRLPLVRRPGPLVRRFPEPHRLTKALLVDLYTACGLSTVHIELLTGQPSSAVRRAMLQAGIPLRAPGGRSPFIRRLHRARGRQPVSSAGRHSGEPRTGRY